MRLEVIVSNVSGKVIELADTWAAWAKTATVPLFNCEVGSEIKAVVRDDKGVFLGTWYAENAFSAKVVTATLFEDGESAVTDDAGNTYTCHE